MTNRIIPVKEFVESLRKSIDLEYHTPEMRDAMYALAHDMFGIDFREEIEDHAEERKEA